MSDAQAFRYRIVFPNHDPVVQRVPPWPHKFNEPRIRHGVPLTDTKSGLS